MKIQPVPARHSLRALRRAGTMRRACVGGMMSVVAATAAWAYQDAESAGLKGILGNTVPNGLDSDENWAVLGPNWASWSEETRTALDDLYAEDPDPAVQLAALEKLKIKLGTIEKALGDSKYRMIASHLSSFQGRLSRRIRLSEALLATMDADPAAGRDARVAQAYGRLSSAVESLQSRLSRKPGGSAWLPYVRAEQIGAAAAANDATPETVELLTKVQQKIDGRDSLADAAQKEFLGQAEFTELSAAIGDVLAAANWQPAADQNEQVRTAAAALVGAIETYEVDSSDASAAAINSAYQQLKGVANDGGEAISQAMRQHYFGHNLRLVASEGFMRKSVADARTEQGYINEPISEAWVSGVSCTYTNVSLDLRPNSRVAQINLQISGTVQTTTTANAAQAVVYGGSNGNFTATKTVSFDGETQSFTTSPAMVSASASTYSTDVDAKVFILLRPIADLIAENEVARRRPQTNAIARQRMVDQVSREVNAETDSRFADATIKLKERSSPLRELGWYPDSIQAYTTDTELVMRARVMDPGELGAQAPAALPAVPDNGVAIQVHESLLNNGADRLGLAGQTMSDADMKKLIEEKITKLLGRPWQFKQDDSAEAPAPAEPAAGSEGNAEEQAEVANAKYVFATEDPLRFRIDDGTVTIVMRAGLEREGKEPIPQHVIEIPLGFTMAGDKIIMARKGNVRVTPGEGTSFSLPRQRLMIAKVEDSIKDRELEGKIKVDQAGKTMTLNVTSIDPQDGWVTVLAK